jgi:hypothetical protein
MEASTIALWVLLVAGAFASGIVFATLYARAEIRQAREAYQELRTLLDNSDDELLFYSLARKNQAFDAIIQQTRWCRRTSDLEKIREMAEEGKK